MWKYGQCRGGKIVLNYLPQFPRRCPDSKSDSLALSFLYSKYTWYAYEYDRGRGKKNGFSCPSQECLP